MFFCPLNFLDDKIVSSIFDVMGSTLSALPATVIYVLLFQEREVDRMLAEQSEQSTFGWVILLRDYIWVAGQTRFFHLF